MEWEYKELFHAAPHAPLSAKLLSQSVKNNSVLIFGPAIRFLKFGHAVHRIWKRDRRDDSPLKKSDWAHEQWVLLYKRGGGPVSSVTLAAPEASVLSSLMKGARLSQALSKAKGMTEARTKSFFAFLAESGLITEVR
ncbi:MAG: hypothetical protein M0D55_18340 [Elusimicrobiota bacterium]|nr:MAG: hypothetical protein M0D55_18340 [Elusimicrobiota bacterium]